MTIEHGFESGRYAHRPVVRGRRLVVSSGHYLASHAGMRMLERGGNAIDAGVATVFAQCVLEFQSAGFGGECPILIFNAGDKRVVAVNGNTRAPRNATPQHYRDLGFTLIPDDGFLSAGVCATPGALMLALQEYGNLSVADVIAPAIELAADGFPVYDALLRNVRGVEQRLRDEWPSSAALLLPEGVVPELGQQLKNPELAGTYLKLVEAERNARGRGRREAIQAAIDRFYNGDIAAAVVEFQRDTTTRHTGGVTAGGLLTREDFAEFRTRIELPIETTYRGLRVYKCGPWSQGLVLLQQLNILEGFDLGAAKHGSADSIHILAEVAKLAFADRERFYGDPDFIRVPLAGLLSKHYAAQRRELIDMHRASTEDRPGDPFSFDDGAPWRGNLDMPTREWAGGTTGTRALDAEGNLFSATPSGGWLRSSPVIPGLGFALGTRLQMFWLDERHPNSLQPGKQPRTTLTPTVVTDDGRPYLGFGTPGGDQQDQWNLQFLVNVVDYGMDIQDAADAPEFHTTHFASSFYPRAAHPGELVIDPDVSKDVLSELQKRGHKVRLADPQTLGNVTAVRRDHVHNGLEASASSRGQKAYALGW